MRGAAGQSNRARISGGAKMADALDMARNVANNIQVDTANNRATPEPVFQLGIFMALLSIAEDLRVLRKREFLQRKAPGEV